MARKEHYLVGLDVGTSKVTAVVGEVMGEGQLDVIGVGLAESRGIKRGMVVNLDAAVDSIKRAVEEAELTAGIEIDYVDLRFDSRVFVRPVGGALARSDLAPGGPKVELP